MVDFHLYAIDRDVPAVIPAPDSEAKRDGKDLLFPTCSISCGKALEKRFSQTKTIHEIAPVLLKNEGRIEALFFLYFVALLVQGLIERELRRGMEREKIEELPLYPEERTCRRPTTEQVLRLFSLAQGHFLQKDGAVVQVFQPELTELQGQVIELLGMSRQAYGLR